MNGPEKNDSKFEGAGRLTGGFAYGNLSEQEKESLFRAALHDQDLFDSLMDEQALKDLLEEPGVKAELIEALQPKVTVLARVKSFLSTPVAWGTFGAVAAAAMLLVVILPTTRKEVAAPQTAQVRQRELQKQREPVPAPSVTSEAAPLSRRVDKPPQTTAKKAPQKDLGQEPLALLDQDKSEQGAAQPPQQQLAQQTQPPQQQQAQQARDSQLQSTSIPPQAAVPAPFAVQQQPAPAAVGRFGQMLTIDYALLRLGPDGSYQTATTVQATDQVRLQVMPGESGYVSLYRRTPEGLMTTVAVAQPVTRGQVVQVPQLGSLPVTAGVYVLVLSRDTASTDAAKSAVSSATPGFRQNAEQMRAKRAAVAPSAPAPPEALSDSSLKKAVLPSVSLGRATAASPDSRLIAVEITIRAEN